MDTWTPVYEDELGWEAPEIYKCDLCGTIYEDKTELKNIDGLTVCSCVNYSTIEEKNELDYQIEFVKFRKKVTELQKEFINKIIYGNYKIEEQKENYVIINIHGYKFWLWLGSNPKFVETWHNSAMQLDFNWYEKEKIYKQFKK